MELTDFPQHISDAVYQNTREHVRDYYKKIDGVLEVAEFGTIPFLGISDMDFLIIVEPGAQIQCPPKQAYSPEQQYAMAHQHFVISKNTFEELNYLDPWLIGYTFLLQNGKGPQLLKKDYDESGHHALSLMLIHGTILSTLSGIGPLGCGKIACRNFLETIKVLEYMHRELARAGIYSDGDINLAKFTSLRKEWFSLPEQKQHERIVQMNELFLSSLGKIMKIMNEYLQRTAVQQTCHSTTKPRNRYQHDLLLKYPDALIVDVGNFVQVFDEKQRTIEVQYAEYSSPLLPYTTQRTVMIMPLALSALQNTHFFGEGLLAEHYRSCVVTERETLPVWQHSAIDKLIFLLNRDVEETRNVSNAKSRFFTFGFKAKNSSVARQSLRSHIGMWHDNIVQRTARTSAGYMLRKYHRTFSL